MTCSNKWQVNSSCVGEETHVDPTEVDGRPRCKNPNCQRPLQGDGTCSRGCAQVVAPASVLALVEQWYDEFPAEEEESIVQAGGQPFPHDVLTDPTIPPDLAMRRLRRWYETLGVEAQEAARSAVGWAFPLPEIERVRAQEERPHYILVDQRGRLVSHELYEDAHAVYSEATRLWNKYGDFVVPYMARPEQVDELAAREYTVEDFRVAYQQWYDAEALPAERALAAEVLARIAATSAGRWTAADVVDGTVPNVVLPEHLAYWLHALDSLDEERGARVRAELQPPPLPPDPRAPTSFPAFAPTLAAMSALTARILTGFPPQGPHATWPLRESNLREAQAALERGAEHLGQREAILLLNQLAEATANTLSEQRTGRVPTALQEEAQRHLTAVRELVTQIEGRYGPPTLTAREQESLRSAYQRWHEGLIEVELDESDEEHFTVRVRHRPEQEWEKSFEVYPAQGRCSGDCQQHLGSRCPHLLLAGTLWRKPQAFTVGEAEQFLAAARRDGWVEQGDSQPPFFYHIEQGGFTARVHMRRGATERAWATVDVRSRDGLPVELTAPHYERAALEIGLQTCAMCGAQSTETVGVAGARRCPACAKTVRKAGRATERRHKKAATGA